MIGNEGNGLSDEIADMADTYILSLIHISDIDNAISTISGYVSACMAGIDEGASDYDKACLLYTSRCV